MRLYFDFHKLVLHTKHAINVLLFISIVLTALTYGPFRNPYKMQVEERSCDYHLKDALSVKSDQNAVPQAIDMYPSVQQSLGNIIKKEGYISHNTFIRMISTEGGNYLGKLYEINVKGETNIGHKEINIFVKHIIPDENVKDVADVKITFANEVFIYTKLGKLFDILQETAQIPEEEKFKLIKSYDETNVDAILLDNLTKKGFKTLYRMDVIPLKIAEKAIKELAKFHALSFVIKHTKTDYLEQEIKTIKTPFYFSEQWKDFVSRLFDSSIKYYDEDVQVQKKIWKFRDVIIEKYPKYITGDMNSVHCLCHGDFRMNNLLVKEDEENIEIALIDYQLIHYGSPVTDLIYFFFISTDQNFRKTHLNDLKDLYHNSLSNFLKHFDLDINNVYPRKLFEKDFEDYLDYGLMIGLMLLPFCFMIEDIPDFSKTQIKDMKIKLDDRFRQRFTEIVEEFIDLGII